MEGCVAAAAVIASAAKQSISQRKERMDCFASLAMTLREPCPASYGVFCCSHGPEERVIAHTVWPINVIASAAKQSISQRKERMDCFASLAMTLREPCPAP